MIDTPELLGFVAASLVVLLFPGPGVVYVVARSVSQGQAADVISHGPNVDHFRRDHGSLRLIRCRVI